MKVQIFFVFLLVLLSNVASADYLECYVCEDCEENEAHLEYCSPIEEIQSALKPDLGTDEVASTTDADDVDTTVEETNSADNTTAFTHLAIDAGNVTATDLDSTKVGVTANLTSATITQTTNSATGINNTTLTNSTTTVLSSVPLEELTTDEEDPENSSDIDDHTISNQTTAGTFTTNGINGTTEGTNQTALGTEVSALSTLNTTETTKITESMDEGTTKNVTVNNGTATGEVVQTTIEIMEANATTLGEDMMVAQTNKTSTVMQSTTNSTDSKESFENMELDHENSTFIEDNAMETTTLEIAENFAENITSTSQEAIAKNLTSVLNNSTTSKPNEINTPLKNETAGQSHETTINFTIGSNSTVSPFIDINITDVPGLTVTTSEVVANTTNFARPNGTSPISNITAEVSTITNGVLTNATNGNFGNTTSMEDPNEVKVSNQTVVEIGYGSGKPNGTSQIGTVNGNFENTAMEDSNEVEISNQIAEESGRPNGTSQLGTGNGSFGNTASMIDPNEVEVSNQTVVETRPGSGRPNGTSQIGTANENFGNTMEDSNEVDTSNQTIVGARPESGGPNGTSQIVTANGNFANTTSMEDSNEVEISNQTVVGTGPESGRPNGTPQIGTANGSGRPNGTSQIATVNGNFENTSMEDSNEVEISNQTIVEAKPESARPNSTSQIGTGNGIGSGSGRPNGTSQIGTANENFGNTTLIEDSNEVDTSNQTIVEARPESARPNSTSQIGTGNGIGFGSGRPNGTSQIGTDNGILSGSGRPNGTSQIGTANENFGNTTLIEDSNKLDTSNQTIVEARPESARPNSTSQIGTGNGIGFGSGRQNGTSQIGTTNENFVNTTSMEDSNKVDTNNQTIVEARPESARPNSTSQMNTGNGIGSGSGRPNGTSQVVTAYANFGNTTSVEDSNKVDTSNQTIVEAQPESARPNSTSQINTGNGIGYVQVVTANGNFGNSTSMEESNEVEISNQTAVGTGPESGRPNGTPQIGTANGSFANTTLMEDSNEVDTSNQTAVGARPESGRPNSTSQIGIANGNFRTIASIEDSNEIEMNNQTSAGTGLTRETTVSSLVLTNSTQFAVENTTTAGRPNSTLHIAIDSGNITSMDEFNNQTLSNETAMGTKPIGEVTASSLVTTNTTNTILLNATDMPNQTGSTNGVLTNTKTVDGLQGASQTGVIGGNFGNITVDISEELNGTKQVNIKAPDLQQMPGTTNVHISSTTAAANSNGTREAFPTEEGMEGLLETNSVNFELMEVPNGITQAEINSASSIKPSNTNGVLQLTTAEASILDGNLASKGDSSSSLFATEKEKLLPKTLKHSRSTLSKINTDKEVFNTKKATAVSEVQRDALRMHQANEFKFARDELKLNPARFIQHKYSRIGNAAGVKLGNITYKCYSVRVKGKNKVQLNKGCVAVPAEKNACELLAAKYGKEALVDCEICVKGKCNRSSSIGLKLSQKSLALIMLLGWLLGGILS
ncbi:serine-rich adhesin for platelets-like [Anastrepha ludens]|uniref:serine-rich adhesin for platelets-like n=1 Tax=Anastrepha ludens TaxID=28586 RepID=UPI0023AF14CB|nr:serine-rich adhesin for platelets-like [Anastrepha ludens]